MTLTLPLFHAEEGLTIDSLYRLLKLLLKPTIAVLYPLAVLAIHRDELISRGLLGLQDVWSGDWRLKLAVGVLGLAIAGKVNDWMSSRARNNWTKDWSWDWENEVALVTGGETSAVYRVDCIADYVYEQGLAESAELSSTSSRAKASRSPCSIS